MAKQKKVERWSYPFKTRSGAEANDPQQYYDALAKAAGGFYPLSRNGLWHGGVHFDEGSASVLDQSEVRCIADGEVIAYRIDEEYPSVSYGEGDAVRKTPYSTGFVLVRHRLELPPAATSASAATPGEEPDLVFYSLYMHLLDWKGYQQKPGLRRPTFWGGDSHQVKASASDRVLGLRVRKQPNGSILGVLPRGTLVEAEAGIGQWLRFVRAIPAVDGVAENSGYIYEDNQNKLKALGGNQYLVGPSASDPVTPLRKGLNIRANASAHADILGVLPPGTRVRIASAASVSKYHKLLEILSGDAIPALAHEQLANEGYVWRNDLEAAQEPQACGSVVPVEPPVAISAGSPIGHLGQYQAYSQDAPQSMLHLEVFSCQDVEAFIAQSRARATQLRPEAKTLLKVPAETKLIIRDDVTQDDPPKISDPGLPTGHDMIIPLAVLNALPNERKITLETNVDGVQQTTRWWKLERMPGKDGQAIDGWLCEIENITNRHSPWDWEGFDFIRETSTLGAQYVCRLDADGTLDDGEKTNYQAHIDEGDSGPIKQRLYDLIDLDDDQRLTAEEIRTALECPWHAQSIGRLITCYESEWYADEAMSKWTALDCYMTKEGERDWEQEKSRIKSLQWWGEETENLGLSENACSWHFHPITLISNNSRPKCKCQARVKVTRWNNKYGPVHWGSKSLSQADQWDELLSSGNITTEEKEIICAMTENEGKIESVQSYDSEVITAGAMQKTIRINGAGELPLQVKRFREENPLLFIELFEESGWYLDAEAVPPTMYYQHVDWEGGKRLEGDELKSSLRQGCNSSTFGNEIDCQPVSFMACAISHPEYVNLQIMDFVARLRTSLDTVPAGYSFTARLLFSTKLGKSLVLDEHINRPGNVAIDLGAALDRFFIENPSVSRDVSTWGADHLSYEHSISEDYGRNRSMTDSVGRYENLRGLLI
ncbi:hypothetical protein FA459_27805 [Pseudomonas aeruginosa]|nr:hypothetical protein [Pseudomonas aeruginosa]MCO1771399.1 hypothetical protein [Pseudomonas aeruginosa]